MTTKRRKKTKRDPTIAIQATVELQDAEGSSCEVSGDLAIVKKLAAALPHYHTDISAGELAVNEGSLSGEEAEAAHAAADAWLDARGVPIGEEDPLDADDSDKEE